MAFQFNPQAYDRGADIVGGYYKKERQDELDRQATADWENRQTKFGQEQEDRALNIQNAENFSFGKGGPGADFLNDLRANITRPTTPQATEGQPAQPAVQPNPTDTNAVTGPTAVTNNVVAGMQPPRTSGRGDPASAMPGLQADLAAQGVRPQAQLDSAGASDAIMMRREIERTRQNLSRTTDPKQQAGMTAALQDMEKVYAMAVQGYANAPQEFRANVPMAQENLQPLAQGIPTRQPVAPVQAQGLQPQQAAPQPAPQAPQEQPQARGVAPAQVDPMLGQLETMAKMAMRKGDVAQARLLVNEYHGRRLQNEMGEVARAAMTMPETEFNNVMERLGQKDGGMQGVLLESKFDPNTGLATLAVGDKKIQVNRQQAAAMLAGTYAIERGAIKEGYELISKVDKDIAAAATGANNLTSTVTNSGNKAVTDAAAMGRDERRTKAYETATKDKAPREVSPETVAQLNTLSQQIAEEQDPVKRRVLEGQWSRLNATAATQLGKVVQPPSRETDPTRQKMLEKGIEAYYKSLQDDPPKTKADADKRRAMFLGQETGLSWDKTPAPISQGTAAPAGAGIRLPVSRPAPNLAPVGANPMSPQPAAETTMLPGGVEVVSQTSNGYNVRLPDGQIKFLTTRQMTEAGLLKRGLSGAERRELGFYS